jgi:hypothetical protein
LILRSKSVARRNKLQAGIDDAASEIKENKEEDDFKAMFGDLKKKKKKKEIPLELVCCSPSF